MKILREAGMVERYKKDLWVHYSISNEPGSPYAATIIMNMGEWLETSNEVMELVGKIPEVLGKDLCRSLTRPRRRSEKKELRLIQKNKLKKG